MWKENMRMIRRDRGGVKFSMKTLQHVGHARAERVFNGVALKSKKGSLTIEAALILPVFMLGLLTLVSVLLMDLAGMRMQASLLTKSEELAVRLADGHNVSPLTVKDELIKEFDKEDGRLIEGGPENVDMSASFLDDPEYIELCLDCNLVPIGNYFGLFRVPYARRCISHVWCGYERGFFKEDEYVYVTNDSEVYHLDRDCSHIRLTVIDTDSDRVGALRNNGGAKYKPCEICHSSLSDGKLYITPEGDRYHNNIMCSGLKRTVRTIKISETGDRRPCSRCGR